MTDTLALAKQATLSLLGGRWPATGPDDAGWRLIAEMAAAHRLEPLLSWRAEGNEWPLPEALARDWNEARRKSSLVSLAQQAALRVALGALDAAGIPFVALKGVPLAWRHYPEPGLRPMRDLDLLISDERAREAFAVLAATGFVADVADDRALSHALADDHQLPPQTHHGLGVTIELHHRLSDPPARRGYPVPQLDPDGVLARAVRIDCGGIAVPCPSPPDLAAHLIVHALYGHRLDCGPLILADLHFLGAPQPPEGTGERGGELLLALTERWFGARRSSPTPIPPEILDAAEDALLADPAGRARAELASDMTGTGGAGAGIVRRLRPDPDVALREGGGLPLWLFWPIWAVRRAWRALGRAGDRRIAREARSAARVIRWLAG